MASEGSKKNNSDVLDTLTLKRKKDISQNLKSHKYFIDGKVTYLDIKETEDAKWLQKKHVREINHLHNLNKKSWIEEFWTKTIGKVVVISLTFIGIIATTSGIGAGIYFGLKDDTSIVQKFVNLSNVQKEEIEEIFSSLNEHYKNSLISFITRTAPREATEQELDSKSFTYIKSLAFKIIDKSIGDEKKTFDQLLQELPKFVDLNIWKNAFLSMKSSGYVVSNPLPAVNNQLLTPSIISDFHFDATLPPITNDIELTYSHPPLNKDGQLTVAFIIRNVHDETQSVIIRVPIEVRGIDVANTKLILETLSTTEINHFSYISAVPSWTELDDNFFWNIIKKEKPVMPPNMEIQYRIPNALTEDGELIVEFRIRKQGDTNWVRSKNYVVKVSGINASYVASIKTMIDALTLKTLIVDGPLSEVNMQNFDNTGNAEIFVSYTPPSNGVNIKYSHSALNSNGAWDFTLFITKGSYTDSITKKIIVEGINIVNARTILEGLSTTEISQSVHIPAVSSWTELDDNFFENIIKKEKPTLPSNIEIQYRIPNAVIEDGELTVEFQIRKWGDTNWIRINDYVVNVVGINAADVALVKTMIDSLTLRTLSLNEELSEVSNQNFDNTGNANVFASYTIPTNGVDVKYSHSALHEDGEITFIFTLTKEEQTDTISKIVAVNGIDQARAVAYLNSLTPYQHERGFIWPEPWEGTVTRNFARDHRVVLTAFEFEAGKQFWPTRNVIFSYRVEKISEDQYDVTFILTRVPPTTTEPVIWKLSYFLVDSS